MDINILRWENYRLSLKEVAWKVGKGIIGTKGVCGYESDTASSFALIDIV